MNTSDAEKPPTMAQEVLRYLQPRSNATYVDMTFGAGGHTSQILQSAPSAKIFALDRDPAAHQLATQLSERYPDRVVPLLGKFSDLPRLLKQHNVEPGSIDGFLFEFGCSSMQLKADDRGFSYSPLASLDMRMDGIDSPEPSAADVIAQANEEDLARIFKVYGNVKQAKKIAAVIVETRYLFNDITTTWKLAQIVESVVSSDFHPENVKWSPQTVNTLLAIRRFVNDELNEINYAMEVARLYLKADAVMITLSFDALEDLIVKRHLSGNIIDGLPNPISAKYRHCGKVYNAEEVTDITESPWKMLHKHVIEPSAEEVQENPAVRRVKFRAIAKVK